MIIFAQTSNVESVTYAALIAASVFIVLFGLRWFLRRSRGSGRPIVTRSLVIENCDVVLGEYGLKLFGQKRLRIGESIGLGGCCAFGYLILFAGGNPHAFGLIILPVVVALLSRLYTSDVVRFVTPSHKVVSFLQQGKRSILVFRDESRDPIMEDRLIIVRSSPGQLSRIEAQISFAITGRVVSP